MFRDLIPRRTFLRQAATAAGGLGLYQNLARAAALNDGHPLAPKTGHFPARAKHLILFFMTGGFSHLDTFDYKPKLQQDHDKPNGRRKLLASPYAFQPYGECGKMVSELFANVGTVIDAMVKSATEKIDRAVTDGDLTQEQADKIKADLKERVTAMVNGELPKFRGPGPFGGPPGP